MFKEWSRGNWTPLVGSSAEDGVVPLVQHNVEQQTDDLDLGIALSLQ